MNIRLAWPAVALAGLAMAAVAVMAIAGVEQQTILVVLALLVSPVLTAFVAVQVADVKHTAQNVERQTNGLQTKQLAIIEKQGEMLAAAPPANHEERPAA